MPLEINKFLTLSTAHVTPEVAISLNQIASGEFLATSWGLEGVYHKGDYGWFISVPGETSPSLPTSLADVLYFARKNSCEWVMFDCDAYQIDGLPTYDWSAA